MRSSLAFSLLFITFNWQELRANKTEKDKILTFYFHFLPTLHGTFTGH